MEYISTFFVEMSLVLATLVFQMACSKGQDFDNPTSPRESGFFQRVTSLDGTLHSDFTIGSPTEVESSSECANICLITPSCASFYVVTNDPTADVSVSTCQMHSVVFKTAAGSDLGYASTYWKYVNAHLCPPEFIFNLSPPMCYRLITDDYTWDGADRVCKKMGSHLVDLKTSDRQHHIVQFIQSTGASGEAYHFGARMNVSSNTWQWSDGTDLTFAAWGPGEPNGAINNWNEECVSFFKMHDYDWGDIKCDLDFHSYPFICEIDME